MNPKNIKKRLAEFLKKTTIFEKDKKHTEQTDFEKMAELDARKKEEKKIEKVWTEDENQS